MAHPFSAPKGLRWERALRRVSVHTDVILGRYAYV